MTVKTKLLTLVLIHDSVRVLLGMKKRGFGSGNWNGFGGKVDVGESIVEGAKRELEEESCIKCDTLDHVGLLNFEFIGDPVLLEVHVFTATKFTGQPQETEEMRPEWFPLDQIPYNEMWADDRIWLPIVLQGKKFSASFRFTKEPTENKIVDYTLDEVEHLPDDCKKAEYVLKERTW